MSNVTLPPGFEDLLPWTDWSLDQMDDRRDRRINSTMDDLDAFYNALLPRMDEVLALLDATDFDKMDEPTTALMNMALALAEIAPAVEQFFEPTVSYGYDVTRFKQGLQ